KDASAKLYPLRQMMGCEFALGRRGNGRFRPKQMAWRIDRTRRRPVLRLRRVGMKRNVACTHRHGLVLPTLSALIQRRPHPTLGAAVSTDRGGLLVPDASPPSF